MSSRTKIRRTRLMLPQFAARRIRPAVGSAPAQVDLDRLDAGLAQPPADDEHVYRYRLAGAVEIDDHTRGDFPALHHFARRDEEAQRVGLGIISDPDHVRASDPA